MRDVAVTSKVKEGFFPSQSKENRGFNCEKCSLYKGCKSPRMNYTGEGQKKCLIISEAPGMEEDERWEELGYSEPTQLIGAAGQLLREKIDPFNLDLDRDFWKINSINCRPPRNKRPTRQELKFCRFMVDAAIAELKPHFIWLLGGAAVEGMYMDRFKDVGITRWRRLCIPDRSTGAWIIPLYHPSFLLRSRTDENLESIFDSDLRWAISCLRKKPPEYEDFKEQVEVVTDIKRLRFLLREVLLNSKEIAIDYETTSLKPFGEGQKIWTMAIADDKGAFSFAVDYPCWGRKVKFLIIKVVVKILREKRIKKIAQNLKFEELWSRGIFGTVVKGWKWCTMNVSHILDSRKKYTGLKFQAYIKYGIDPYDGDVREYMKVPPGKNVNRLNEVPLRKLLLYGGIDAYVAYRLCKDQERSIGRSEGLSRAYSLFHGGLLALSGVEYDGISVDEEYYSDLEGSVEREVKELESSLLMSKEAKAFRKSTRRDLKLTSNDDLRELFFDVLGLKSEKVTKGGQLSVDHEVVEGFETPFTRKLIRKRKLEKVKGTYLAQFGREACEGKIHPFLDLHIPRSYRGSSSRPNIHNIPVKDEDIKRMVRMGIIPDPGDKILEADYKGIEVRMACCYTKDPVLIEDVSDPDMDMHRDQGMEVFLLTTEEMTEDLRFYTKNQLVFPVFYGSYWRTCAGNLWKVCRKLILGGRSNGITVEEHLKAKGIMGYKDFESHVREVEKNLWDRYWVFKEWQDAWIDAYRRKGYVELLSGFRRGGYLGKNEILNTAFQGAAFHCLLASLIEINRIRKWERWRTRILMHIHDSIVFNLCSAEQDHVLQVTKEVMCKSIKEVYDWIIVPLEVNFELAGIDKPWYLKKKLNVF